MKLWRNIAWTLSWRFRRKELFYLCLSLAHLLTLCHIEATSRRRGGTRRDPPALQGYHHSPPPFSPLISSAFALWAIAELYILGPSLTPSLSPFLPSFLSPAESWKNHSILMLGLWNLACSILGHNIFWNFLEACLEFWYTRSKCFLISCMCVSLLVGLLPYWNYVNIGISPVLDEISFWTFFEAFLGGLYTCSK